MKYLPKIATAIALTALAVILPGCGGSNSNNTTVAQEKSCADITTTSLHIPGLVVTSATVVNASTTTATSQSYPTHCDVLGKINERTGIDGKPYAIGFDIKLPISGWNGKFFYSGDAGTDGVFFAPLGGLGSGQTTNALSLGYAVASSDGGHNDPTSFDTSFGLDPQARIDYGYNALGTLTPLAKTIVSQFYGTAPTRSYYMGCSKGGETGLMAATRYADQFDGIVAGAPGFDLPKAAVAQIYDSQQLLSIPGSSNVAGPPGVGGITGALSSQDIKLLSNSILNKCDALDGATDGMASDTAACQAAFNLTTDVPLCAPGGAASNGTCLSTAQKTALSNIFSGAKDTAGNLIYADWPWDPGITGNIPFVGWAYWKLSLNPLLGPMSVGNIFTTPPTAVTPTNAATFLTGFDMNRAYPWIYGSNATYTESPMSFMSPPDRVHFTTLKSKGKLIVYHGAADPVFSANHTINWYKNVAAADSTAANYARLFVVPGMNHCGGGVATDNVDAFSALVKWVEQDSAPDSIMATVSAGNPDVPASWSPNRSRPICAYPKKAILKTGATDLESAGSFVCQ
ncbi:MAG: feruloyl esterase [Comamonadaceae bacterium]|nr:MAG: feruloyl esterase [Comamonadaceae bacterium]